MARGGAFWPTEKYQGVDYTKDGAWEVAVGTAPRLVGIELSAGMMTTHAGGLKVQSVPVLLTGRLQIPLLLTRPRLEVGVGAYFDEATAGGVTSKATTGGWHAGVGCDVELGRLVVGAVARYLSWTPSFENVGDLKLNRWTGLITAGVTF